MLISSVPSTIPKDAVAVVVFQRNLPTAIDSVAVVSNCKYLGVDMPPVDHLKM